MPEVSFKRPLTCYRCLSVSEIVGACQVVLTDPRCGHAKHRCFHLMCRGASGCRVFCLLKGPLLSRNTDSWPQGANGNHGNAVFAHVSVAGADNNA